MQNKKAKKEKVPTKKKNNLFTLQIEGRRNKTICGSLDFLTAYFDNVLKSGHEKNSKINIRPNNIKNLLTNVNKVYSQKEKESYYPAKVSLIKETCFEDKTIQTEEAYVCHFLH